MAASIVTSKRPCDVLVVEQRITEAAAALPVGLTSGHG
jgi:hypothetical protein